MTDTMGIRFAFSPYFAHMFRMIFVNRGSLSHFKSRSSSHANIQLWFAILPWVTLLSRKEASSRFVMTP
jgi:hypothetical protein